MLSRSLSNEHDMGSNLMGIRRHMICIGKQNRRAKKVYSDWFITLFAPVVIFDSPLKTAPMAHEGSRR